MKFFTNILIATLLASALASANSDSPWWVPEPDVSVTKAISLGNKTMVKHEQDIDLYYIHSVKWVHDLEKYTVKTAGEYGQLKPVFDAFGYKPHWSIHYRLRNWTKDSVDSKNLGMSVFVFSSTHTAFLSHFEVPDRMKIIK